MRDATAGRLSGLDAAFLCLESAAAPLHLGGLAVFQPGRPVTPAQLRGVLRDRAGRMPRLRWRLSRSVLAAPAAWVEDGEFDAARHIQVHRLSGGDHDALAALAARLIAEPLDLERPPWQLHLVTGLAEGRFAVLLKVHHALADGLRAMEIGLGLLDGLAGREGSRQAEVAGQGAGRRADEAGQAGGRQADEAGQAIVARDPAGAPSQPGSVAELLAGALTGVPQLLRDAAGTAGIAASVLSRLRLPALDSPLAPPAAAQGAAPARALGLVRLELADVRRVRSRYGGTDNDVLLAVLAGAVREWLTGRGHSGAGLEPRVLVPVSRRHRPGRQPGLDDRPRAHGNLLSGYLCPLPVAEPDPVARLQAVRAAMSRNKAAGPTRGAGAFALLAERVPAVVHQLAAPLTRHGAGFLFDAVVTNVPVPPLSLTLGGAPLGELYPIVPLAHGQALGVALSTYHGAVHLGLHADARAVPDLDRLADAVPAALTELVKTTDQAG